MPPIIGIDLGTTNTAVAVLESGRPRMIEDERGYKVLPSVVSAKGDGRFVVGQAAHSLILTRPDRTVYAAKRLIGRRFDSPEVQRVRDRVGYAIQEAPDGGVQLQVGDTWMTPQEVGAVVLQVARGIAEKALGQPIEEAVIAVPAHFNHAQRKATLEAAEIAGLRCERLLNEPTAAALAYGHRKTIERTLLIFDLGGGTFDVSVLRLSSGLYEILATDGDTFLGGEDFDYRLVDWLADQFKARTGLDFRGDKNALQRVKDAAERAKCELSFSDRTNVVVPQVASGQGLDIVLTRTQLEALTADLVERCLEVAREAVSAAGLAIGEVEEVILVGGQTRMPLVRERVAALFGREPSRTVHPEEAVAIGAAVHAASLGEVEGPRAVLLDVTPFDLGIDSAGGLFSKIVTRNARIPCAESRTFATAHDGQTTVRITVRQGEGRLSVENEFLGEFLFEGLTPAARMETKVGVTFRIDANGILHVSAVEANTGEKRNISIRNYADATRTVVAGAQRAAAGVAAAAAGAAAGAVASAAAAPAAAPKPGVAKKRGFFDQLFGSKPARPTPKTLGAAATPAPVTQPGAAAAIVAPPPMIDALPTPPETRQETLAPLDEAVEALAELDTDPEGDAFEMPEDYHAPEDELYEPSTASGPATFGLAGAHQVGGGAAPKDLAPPPAETLAPSGDPFSNPTAAPMEPQRAGPTAAPVPPTRPPVHEIDENDLGLLDLPDDLAGLFDESPTGMRPNPAAAASGDPFVSRPPAPPPPARPSGDPFGGSAAPKDPVASAPKDPFAAPSKDPFATPPRREEAAAFASPSDFDDPTGMRRIPGPGPADSFDDAPTGMRAMPVRTETASLTPGLKRGRDTLPPTPTLSPKHGPVRTGNTAPARVPSAARDAAAGSEFELITDPITANSLSLENLFSDEATNDPPTDPRKAAARRAASAPTAVPEVRPNGDAFGFVLSEPPSPPTPPAEEEETLGFAFADLNADEAADRGSPTLAPAVPVRKRLDEDFVFPMGDDEPEVPRRKPARVRLAYRNHDAFVMEYRANLKSGGAVVVTDRPLTTGRECVFEISSPGLLAPMVIPAHVTRVTPDGMEVSYDLDAGTRDAMLAALDV